MRDIRFLMAGVGFCIWGGFQLATGYNVLAGFDFVLGILNVAIFLYDNSNKGGGCYA